MSLSDVEKVAFARRVMAEMKVYSEPALTGIYGVIDEQWGQLIGSGTYVQGPRATCVLTAGHCVSGDETEKYAGLGRYVGPGRSPVLLESTGLVEGGIRDIAAIPVAGELGDRKPFPISRLAESTDGVENDLFFLQGLPGERSHWYSGIHSTSQPIAAVAKKCGEDWFDPGIHIAVQYEPEGLEDETGSRAEFINPKGVDLTLTGRRRVEGGSWRPGGENLAWG